MNNTDCYTEELRFEDLGRRKVVAKFDGGAVSSDAGLLLLREADRMFNVIGRFAACFTDHRNPSRVEHSEEAMLRQRVYGICLGYEDVNDHDRLRDDAVLAMGVGCKDVTGTGTRSRASAGGFQYTEPTAAWLKGNGCIA